MQHLVRRTYAAMTAGVLSLLLALAGSFCQAQAKTDAGATDAKNVEVLLPGAVYDVTTIKPHDPNINISFKHLPNGGFIATGTTLKGLVCYSAYGKFDFQCLGGPAWFDSEQYDVEAKPDSALSDQLLKLRWKERTKVQERMQQALLEDRIKLKVHHETRELPIFTLVVAKGGLKIHEAKAGDTYANGMKAGDGKGMVPGSYVVGNGKMQAWGVSMDTLADQLTDEVGHIVQDQTWLAGVYDFTLRYSDDMAAKPDSSAPSLYTALQEQLGLKLVPTKAPVDVLIIDHVERPSAN